MGLSKQTSKQVYDPIRNTWVAATPEELVRQYLLQRMIGHGKYPKQYIAVEKELRLLPHLVGQEIPPTFRRADIICFAPGIHPDYALYPLLLIECKKDALDAQAIEQLLGYNHFVKAPYVAAVGGQEIRLGYFEQEYKFINHLPTYDELLQRL